MPEAYIKDISIYTPEKKLTNSELAVYFNVEEKKIFRESGIRKRHICSNDELASDIAVKVGTEFFNSQNHTKREDIDFLFYCTSALDYVGPATACLIHEQLDLKKSAGAMDIPMGCAGFTYGLILCKSMIESGIATNILFITADMPTKVIHPDDYYLRILFSDAAAATLISDSGSYKINSIGYGTDGSGGENLIIKGSGARNPINAQWLDQYKDVGGLLIGRMVMKGDEILKFTLREIPQLVDHILAKENLSKDDVDYFVFHHASEIVLKFLARKLAIPSSKIYSTLEENGNTVSASIPIALNQLHKEIPMKKKSIIFIAGFGIGYAWSGTILKTN